MTLTKSKMWMVAAVVTLAATGCAPRSAKEFSGTYAGTDSGTYQIVTVNPDGSTTTKSESGSATRELTLNAPDDATIVFGTDSSFGSLTFRQSASTDTVFDAVPQTWTDTYDGVTSTTKLDSGSISFTGLDVFFSYNITSTRPYTDSNGLVTTLKTTINGSFYGTKK